MVWANRLNGWLLISLSDSASRIGMGKPITIPRKPSRKVFLSRRGKNPPERKEMNHFSPTHSDPKKPSTML